MELTGNSVLRGELKKPAKYFAGFGVQITGRAVESHAGSLLKDVQIEVIAFVVRTFTWVEVVPVFVVNRDSHIFRIAVIEIVIAPLRSLEVLGIIDIGVIVESFPVGWLSASGCQCISRGKNRP